MANDNTESKALASNARTMTHSGNEPLEILLVEDVVSDAILTRVALDAVQLPYKLRTIRKGDEVLSHFWNIRHSEGQRMPDCMIMDLGLPGMNGFEILDCLAVAPAFIRSVPIVILTGYEHFSYIQKTYDLWIADYLQKPCNVQKMRDVILRIHRAKRSAS